MNLVTMIFENADGKIIEKKVEERLASTYIAIGWKVKKERAEKHERFYDQPKKREK